MSCALISKPLRVALATLAAVLFAGASIPAAHAEPPPAADPLAALEAQQQALFERIAPSVIFITDSRSSGSGFFVTDDGLALTNAHVVGDASEVQVVLRDGRRLTARVVARAGESVDLALVQVPIKSSRPLELGGFADLRVGSWVAAVGHGEGQIWTYTTGMVSNIYPGELNKPVFQTQIPVNPGASGGPVFDRRGRVVGVVTAGISRANSINFAIRTDAAFRLFERLAPLCQCLTIAAPAGVPVFVDNQMVGKGPRLVLPLEAGNYEVMAIIGGTMNKKVVRFPTTREVVLD